MMRRTIGILIASLGLVLGLSACGDDGGGDRALCVDSCERSNECFEGVEADCDSICSGGGGGESCSNAGEIRSHIRMCLDEETCEDYQSCSGETPECE